MSLETNLNQAPYFADFNANNDHYQILFQPGVSVQTRELNNLQLMLQLQIQRFGDNIFQTGTIVSGCNFIYFNPMPYIKIKDLDITGTTTVPSRYLNYNIINETSNLNATIVTFQDGFEATDPNLKTLYLSYQNTGNVSSNTLEFSSGDILKVYDPVMNGVELVNIINGGIGFSNTDFLLAISPLVVTVSSGTISNGDFLINNLGANVQVVSVDTTTFATSNQQIVIVKPRAVDLANSAANSQSWTLNVGDSVTNINNNLTASLDGIIGVGFIGGVVTNGVGTIIDIKTLSKGLGYTVAPYMTVRSIGNASGYNSLNLIAQNYVTKLVVASNPSAVGNGYGFGVTQGVIYQKGYFLRVSPQQIIVSKYDQNP